MLANGEHLAAKINVGQAVSNSAEKPILVKNNQDNFLVVST